MSLEERMQSRRRALDEENEQLAPSLGLLVGTSKGALCVAPLGVFQVLGMQKAGRWLHTTKSLVRINGLEG